MHRVTLRLWISLTLLFAVSLASTNFAYADLVLPGSDSNGSGPVPDVPAGGVVTGRGIVQLSSESAWYMDGTLRGESQQSPIVLDGFVKGTGFFDNVVFDGIFAPGHSPALVTVGNTIYTASNVLEIELGGLLPGSQHDKIVHNGFASVAGTLDVVLINAFIPQLGNAFDIFDWNAGLSGTFSTVNLPPLNPGLTWDASDLYIGGQLVVTAVPESSAFWLMACSTMLFVIVAFVRRVWKSTQPAPLAHGIE